MKFKNIFCNYFYKLLINKRYVREFNSAHKIFKLGFNKFVCYTQAEYQSIIGTVKVTPKSTQKVDYVKVNKPESIDWRDKCLVNQIRDQGLCSSGYVSAMTQACESSYGLTHTFLPMFSD